MFMAIFFMIDFKRIFIFAFMAAIAEAFSDTWSSGFGALAKKTYKIIGLKPIEKGLSGGVSLVGTLSGIAAAFLISSIGLAFRVVGAVEYLIIASVASVGSFFDSILGALLQVKYRCNKCGIITEKRIHCDEVTEKFSGLSFITNDAVNLLSTLFSSIVTIIIFIII